MWKWNSLLFSAVLFATPALAAIPVVKINVPNQVSAAQAVLEAQIGARLTAEQKAKLEQLAQEEQSENYILAGTETSKSIYCVGYNIAAGTSLSQAACTHIWSLRGYTVGIIGVGITLNLTGQVFRLKVTYDSSRYDQNFDPVPGSYGIVSQGLTIVGGATVFEGSSGNKRVSGGGLNLGLGGDFLTGSYLVIED